MLIRNKLVTVLGDNRHNTRLMQCVPTYVLKLKMIIHLGPLCLVWTGESTPLAAAGPVEHGQPES